MMLFSYLESRLVWRLPLKSGKERSPQLRSLQYLHVHAGGGGSGEIALRKEDEQLLRLLLESREAASVVKCSATPCHLASLVQHSTRRSGTGTAGTAALAADEPAHTTL